MAAGLSSQIQTLPRSAFSLQLARIEPSTVAEEALKPLGLLWAFLASGVLGHMVGFVEVRAVFLVKLLAVELGTVCWIGLCQKFCR